MNNSLKVFRLPIRVTACLFSLANRFSHWMILGLVVILCLLEIGAYLTQGVIPVIASRAWALMGVTYFAATAILIARALLSDLRQRKCVFALLVIGLGIMVFYRLGDIYHLEINYESAGQLASFLKYNIHKPDWAYTLPGYLGYPARQFIIPAIPSLLFGNDVFWLQLGYAILFYSGVLCFFLGVRHYFSIKQHGELWALFTVLSCFTFPYLMQYLHNMEQVMLPRMLCHARLGLVSAQSGKADPAQGSDSGLDCRASGYILHAGSRRLDIISNFLSVGTCAGSTSGASSANRFMGFGLGLYVDIRPLLLSYSRRCPFDTTTRTFCRVSADCPESVLSRTSARVYASSGCYSRRHFFLASTNRTPGVHQMDYCRVVSGSRLFFSHFIGNDAI
jgi:hypothetical protein